MGCTCTDLHAILCNYIASLLHALSLYCLVMDGGALAKTNQILYLHVKTMPTE